MITRIKIIKMGIYKRIIMPMRIDGDYLHIQVSKTKEVGRGGNGSKSIENVKGTLYEKHKAKMTYTF